MDINTHPIEGNLGKPDQLGEKVTAVDGLVNIGVSVTKACAQVGIPRVTYYYRKRFAQKNAPGSQQHEG